MKAKFGSVVVAGSGKLGGSVFSIHRGRAIFSKINLPAGSSSISQFAHRSLFASIVSRWRTLTETERTAWSVLAASLTSVDVFNDFHRLDGYHAFVKCNYYRLLFSHSLLLSPVAPGSFSRAVIDDYYSFFEESNFGFRIVLQEPISQFGDIIFQASRLVSPGASVRNVNVSILKLFPSSFNYEFDPVREYEERFGKVFPTTRHFLCRLTFICPNSGIPYQVLNFYMPIPFIIE